MSLSSGMECMYHVSNHYELNMISHRLLCSDPILIADNTGRLPIMLAGCPAGDVTWYDATRNFLDALAKAKAALKFGKKSDRRGPFRTIAVGVSYGGGQTVILCI